MKKLLKASKKIIQTFSSFNIMLNSAEYDSVNLYFQDESRFGLMTPVGRCLTAKGVKPIVNYKHCFDNTYLYGSFSPLDGDMFVYEIDGVSSEIFYEYLKAFSEYRPKEIKVILIDNAGFHSLKDFTMPKNIKLVRIPPYSPELNPSEKIWAYIKYYFKNKLFDTLDDIKNWLHKFVVENLTETRVKSITHQEMYLNAFNACFN